MCFLLNMMLLLFGCVGGTKWSQETRYESHVLALGKRIQGRSMFLGFAHLTASDNWAPCFLAFP